MIDIKEMQAAVLVEQNQPLVVDEVELPTALDYGQVLVEVHYSGLCGSQLGEIKGVKGADKFLPHLLGHEGSGVVLDVGPRVSCVNIGDHVVMHWRAGRGIEACPPVYKWRGEVLNAGYVTTLNEYAIVSENRLTTIPKDYPMDLAPLFGCAVTTGLGVVENNANLKMGESIVVIGAGGIGLNVIQGALLRHAYPIIAVDLYENRLSLAEKIGATHCINTNLTENWPEVIREHVGVEGADVVVDNTGNSGIISTCIELTKPQGRTILVGVPKTGDPVSLYTLPLHFGKVLVGSHGGDGNPTLDIPRYLRLSKKNIISLSPLITERFSLLETNTAVERMKNGSLSGRCLISMKTERKRLG